MTSTRARPRFVTLAAACAAASACAGGGSRTESALPLWTVTEEVRIGSAEDPSRTLSPVSSLAVDDDGHIYVAQPNRAMIQVFDQSGEPLGAIGRRGIEDGQFERVYTIGFLGDTLYAIDLGHRRIEYFSRDGTPLRTVRVSPPPVSPPFFPSMPFAVFPDGSRAVGTAFPPTLTPDELRRVPQLRSDSTGMVLDTVTWIAYERTARRASYEGRPLAVGSVLSDDAFAVFSEDGTRLVTVDRSVAQSPGSATFGVTLADGWGDTIYTRRYEYEPITIESQVIDSLVVARAGTLSSVIQDQDAAVAFVRNAMFLPVYYPPVNAAMFSESGALWLQREGVPGQRQRWMILNESGDPVAEALLPAGLQVLRVRDDAIWGVEYDAGGVPFVVRYGVVR